jgi:signal transduction histidine kinase
LLARGFRLHFALRTVQATTSLAKSFEASVTERHDCTPAYAGDVDVNTRIQNSTPADKIDNVRIVSEGETDRGLTSKTPPPLSKLDAALTADIAAVSQIDAVASILEVVCQTTGMGFAAVARVTPDRWVACAVRDEIAFGLLPGGELDVKTTICDEIRDSGRAVIIDHVAEDEQFRSHHTPRMYGLQSYISMPIVLPSGAFFGTLCAIDPRPARLNTPAVIGMFKNFAQLIAFHLDAQERAASQEAALVDAREAADLREQFVAILAHDLRNPLASIDAGINVLLRRGPDEKTLRDVGGHIRKSAKRMAGLIDDMLDFAKGRLGGGLSLDRNPDARLQEHLEQVIGELRDVSENAIEADIVLQHPVICDPKRIAQVASNLVANALKHGSPNHPVRVLATTDERRFELAVVNAGEPIDPAVIRKLFLPFFRGNGRSSNQGLGLGLYIASEIARAHGGQIEVASSADETRFTLHIPRT